MNDDNQVLNEFKNASEVLKVECGGKYYFHLWVWYKNPVDSKGKFNLRPLSKPLQISFLHNENGLIASANLINDLLLAINELTEKQRG